MQMLWRYLLDRLKPVCHLGCRLSEFSIGAFYRMLHNLLAHNSPSGIARGQHGGAGGCETEDTALLSLPIMDSVPPALPCLKVQPGNGDACSLRALSIKRRKLITAKLGAEQERMKQVVCRDWTFEIVPWEMQESHSHLCP